MSGHARIAYPILWSRAILRTRAYYSIAELIHQFKAHVWSIIEYYTPCVYHAGITLLRKLDIVQERFLDALDISEEEALICHAMAPLSTRRDIAILGLLHKCNLGLAHRSLCELFYRDPHPPRRNTTLFPPLHERRLFDEHVFSNFPSLFHNSIFAQIRIYNLLSPAIANHDNVHEFQSALVAVVRHRCSVGHANWQTCLSSRSVGHVYSIA